LLLSAAGAFALVRPAGRCEVKDVLPRFRKKQVAARSLQKDAAVVIAAFVASVDA
jgi:hypothetical protein